MAPSSRDLLKMRVEAEKVCMKSDVSRFAKSTPDHVIGLGASFQDTG